MPAILLHIDEILPVTATRVMLLEELIYLFMPSLHEQQNKSHNVTVVSIRIDPIVQYTLHKA
jgi:hypothetical protein